MQRVLWQKPHAVQKTAALLQHSVSWSVCLSANLACCKPSSGNQWNKHMPKSFTVAFAVANHWVSLQQHPSVVLLAHVLLVGSSGHVQRPESNNNSIPETITIWQRQVADRPKPLWSMKLKQVLTTACTQYIGVIGLGWSALKWDWDLLFSMLFFDIWYCCPRSCQFQFTVLKTGPGNTGLMLLVPSQAIDAVGDMGVAVNMLLVRVQPPLSETILFLDLGQHWPSSPCTSDHSEISLNNAKSSVSDKPDLEIIQLAMTCSYNM